MPISEKLIEEIEEKRWIIQNDPDYFLRRSQRIKSDLRSMGNIHSYWIEHPEERNLIMRGSGEDKRKLRKEARKSIGKIMDAWRYLQGMEYNSSILNAITPELILDVGGKVDSRNMKGFRTERVSLGLVKYTPPNPIKVPVLVENFCKKLKDSDYFPVEAAITVHLGIAGIQPFIDGNKRTGRLLQDRILDDNGLPPAIIPAGERHVYIDVLEDALAGMRDNDLRIQRPFYDYVAGKVNVAMDRILNDLDPKKVNGKGRRY
jgi:hypothetical protein